MPVPPVVPTVLEDVLASDVADATAEELRSAPVRAARTAKRRLRWAREAALAAVALAALGGFLAVQRVVTRGTYLDRRLVERAGRARTPVATAIARGVTSLGSAPGAVVVSLAAMLATRSKPKLAVQVAVGALGGVTAELGLKRLYRRERPRLLEHLENVQSTSFPSGHAMAASSLYLTLAFVSARGPRRRPRRALALVVASSLATSIAATRVYLGVHWPTDVLGGLVLGTAWACAAEAVFDFAAAERIEREVLLAPRTGLC